MLPSSTWSTAAFLHQTLPVFSVSDLPLAISWSYHVIVAVGSDLGHSPWQVRWSGTCCLIISVIHRSASDLFDQHWRHSFSQCTGTRSAVQALCVMCYTSRQSSSSSSSSSLSYKSEKRTEAQTDRLTQTVWLLDAFGPYLGIWGIKHWFQSHIWGTPAAHVTVQVLGFCYQ